MREKDRVVFLDDTATARVGAALAGAHAILHILQQRELAKELEDDEDDELMLVDIEDEYDCTLVGVYLVADGDGDTPAAVALDDNDNKLHVDFKNQNLTLPKVSHVPPP